MGVFTPHNVDAVYFGWAGDGHIERFNVSHQMYYVMGYDAYNPLAGQAQDIRAAMAHRFLTSGVSDASCFYRLATMFMRR